MLRIAYVAGCFESESRSMQMFRSSESKEEVTGHSHIRREDDDDDLAFNLFQMPSIHTCCCQMFLATDHSSMSVVREKYMQVSDAIRCVRVQRFNTPNVSDRSDLVPCVNQ
jgi:hypothetical protein